MAGRPLRNRRSVTPPARTRSPAPASPPKSTPLPLENAVFPHSRSALSLKPATPLRTVQRQGNAARARKQALLMDAPPLAFDARDLQEGAPLPIASTASAEDVNKIADEVSSMVSAPLRRAATPSQAGTCGESTRMLLTPKFSGTAKEEGWRMVATGRRPCFHHLCPLPPRSLRPAPPARLTALPAQVGDLETKTGDVAKKMSKGTVVKISIGKQGGQGPQGPPGRPGPQGPVQGEQGPPGIQGIEVMTGQLTQAHKHTREKTTWPVPLYPPLLLSLSSSSQPQAVLSRHASSHCSR